MLTLINGINTNKVSVSDRGLMYGQSVFETIAVSHGKACLLQAHLDRLLSGAQLLGIEADIALTAQEVTQLAEPLVRGVVRVNLTMGEGGRGYQNPVDPSPTRIISQYKYPNYLSEYWLSGIQLGLADIRLAQQPYFAGIKHGNRLEQTIARSQWVENWQEALLLDVEGNVIEGTQSNVFLVKEQSLITPLLDKAGVKGVMRQHIIELAGQLGLKVVERSVSLDDIVQADEVFMSNSIIGLWPVKCFENALYKDLTVSSKILKIIIKNEFIPTF